MAYFGGTPGDDFYQGGDENDHAQGFDGDDTLRGGAGVDHLEGGDGRDLLVGETGNDTLNGGGAGERNRMFGEDGDDHIIGYASDRLEGAAGIDTLVLVLTPSSVSYVIDIADLYGAGLRLSDGTRAFGFEKGVFQLGAGDDHVTMADLGGFRVEAGAGDDTVLGGDGDDHMGDGGGNDVLQGGAGIDWLGYVNGGRAVRVSLAVTGPQKTKGAGTDTLSGFENLAGSGLNDLLIGDAGDNEIHGIGGGDAVTETGDTINGGGGDDTINAAGSWAELKGGAGNDRLAYQDYHLREGTDYQTLTGGKGQDELWLDLGSVAVFESLADSTRAAPDRVFIKSLDYDNLIDLHLIDANVNLAGDQAFKLVPAFRGRAGDLMMETKTLRDGSVVTFVLMDVDGDARADSKIVMDGDQTGFDGFVL